MSKKKSRYEILREQRRFKIVPLDINLIGTMFIKSDVKYTFQGLPKDAIFVHADRDVQQQAFQFIYLHESFEPVEEGVVAPSLFITVTQTNPEADTQGIDLQSLDSEANSRQAEAQSGAGEKGRL